MLGINSNRDPVIMRKLFLKRWNGLMFLVTLEIFRRGGRGGGIKTSYHRHIGVSVG